MDPVLIQAQGYANSSMLHLGWTAKRLDRAASEVPDYAERLQRLADQLWEMEKSAREVERELAYLNSELRTNSRGD